jgi:hypothetical protein
MFKVYLHYDNFGQLLYVGSSTDAQRRTFDHQRSPWFNMVVRIGLIDCLDYQHMLDLERQLIEEMKPLFNRRGNKPVSFRRFVFQQNMSEDPVGDFVLDVIEDREFPEEDRWALIYIHLILKDACPEAIKAARKLWRRYKRG